MRSNKQAWLAMAWIVAGGALAVPTHAAAQAVALEIGSVVVTPADAEQASCVQVPISIRDTGDTAREIKALQIALELSDDAGIILGGKATAMMIAQGFAGTAGTGLTGIEDPAVDLTGGSTCGLIFNQATQGDAELGFVAGNQNAEWIVIEDSEDVGRKVAIAFHIGQLLGSTSPGDPQLVLVLEVPIIADPGPTRIRIDPLPENNVIGWANEEQEDLDLSAGGGSIDFFESPDCEVATLTDDLGGASGQTIATDYLDASFGGSGAELTLDLEHPDDIQLIEISGSDGYFNDTAPDGPGATQVALSTASDGTPYPEDPSVTYTVTYLVEFPLGDGELVGGEPCELEVLWNPPTCELDWLNNDVGGPNSTLTLTATNAFDGAPAATVDVPDGATGLDDPVDVGAGSLQGSAGNESVFLVVDAQVPDVSWAGTYQAQTAGPGGQSVTCDAYMGFACPSGVEGSSATVATIGG
ncbi:MAG: hypothetical protein JRI25_13240, partial [Deltaproteobacteria bacterium]|nr:hypothetical protein [Deltaproteobacteria bacterium]